MQDRFRENDIDFIKGFGIILMIMGHIPFGVLFRTYIYSFHMPLFFIASGFLYKKTPQPFSYLLKKWAKRLLVPYLFFSLAGYILWYIELKPANITEMIVPIKAIFWINTVNMPIAGALWYLTATFFVYLIWFLIDNVISSQEKVKLIIICILVLFGLFETSIFSFRLPWAIDVACVGVGFYYYGKQLHIYISTHRNKVMGNYGNKVKLVLLLIISSMLGIINGQISMRTGNYGNSRVIFAIVSLSICSCYWLFAKEIIEKFNDNIIIKYLENVGKNSIVYLCLNEIVINVVNSILCKMGISGSLLLTLKFVISLIIIEICLEIIKKNKALSLIVGFK